MHGIRGLQPLLLSLAVAAAYFAAALIGDDFAGLYAGYAPFWPAAGVASGLLVVLGLRYAPAIAIASIAVAMLRHFPLAPALWFGTVDAAEAVVVAWLVRRAGINTALTRPRDVARFALAGIAGGIVSSSLAGPPFLQFMPSAELSVEAILTGWMAGNAIAHLIVGGLLLVWSSARGHARAISIFERAAIAASALLIVLFIFLRPSPQSVQWKYLVLALITWTAVRLGQRAMSATLVGVAGIAAWAAAHHTGPFTPLQGPLLQVFLGICGLAGFGIAAVAAEREEAAGLREREARYRALADASPNLMWSGRSNGAIDFLNRQAIEYTGVTASPLELNWTMNLVHPDDRERCLRVVRPAMMERRTYALELRLRRKDGACRWHWCVAVPTDHGSLEGPRWIGTATDIHDRKLAELEVASWRTHYERAQAVGQLGSWESETGEGAEHLVWSSELFRIFGIPPDSFDGRTSTFYERVHPDDRERVKEAVARAVASATRYSIDHRIVRPDGEIRWVHEEGDLTPGPDGSQRLLGVCRDITDRVRAEDERRSLEASLLQAQKLESLGILTGGIAHDFNNLLVGILGNASLALLDLPLDAPARRAVERIETSSMRAADLIRQMLAYSGKAAMQFERVEVSSLVREMGDLLSTAISKKAALRYELSHALPPVEADPTQLRQIVMNLITNASDAIGEAGGTITVSTGLIEIDPPAALTVLAGFDAAPGTYVRIAVADTGIGMDRETQARIFDPFFTTKFTGRGLGLAAVQGIVRSHRGAVRVESAPGRGTTFTVLLPRSAAHAAGAAGPEPPHAPLTNLFSGTVLIIDDEDGVRQAISRMLARFGFTVLQASGGLDGFAVFTERRDAIALVVLDLTMPDMSGAEVFARIRTLDARVPVMLASGYGRTEATSMLEGDAHCAFLQKPFRPQALADTIAELLEAAVPASRA